MASFPNPSTQFKPGVSGNPGGKSSSHRKAEIKAAELAAGIQLELVEALAETFKDAKSADKVEQIRGDILKLLKDSQDRGFGQATQPIDATSSDGSMSPVSAAGDAVLAAIKAKHEPES